MQGAVPTGNSGDGAVPVSSMGQTQPLCPISTSTASSVFQASSSLQQLPTLPRHLPSRNTTFNYCFLLLPFHNCTGGALCCSALICVLRNHFLRHNLLNGEGKQGLENTAMGSLAAEKCRTCLSVNPADVHATHVPSLLLLSPTHQGGQVHSAF